MFEDLPQPDQAQVQQAQAKAARSAEQGAPRLLEPDRSQIELRASDLESLLAEDHRARLVSGYVVRQDLRQLVEAVKARGSKAGRAAIDSSASCSRFGCTPRWTVWAAGARWRG